MQPIDRGYGTSVVAAGSVVIQDSKATVDRILWNGTGIGTLTVYDASATTGTSLGGRVFLMGVPASQAGQYVEVGRTCKDGIVSEMAGTLPYTLIWHK